MSSSPKLSAPTLHANIVPTRVLKEMGTPERFDGHWLFAGPGAGKTQLARLWVEQVGRPYAWLQLAPQDKDPLLFLEQLRLALQPLVLPHIVLPSFAPQSGVSLQRHCEYLWQMLLDTLRAPCVIVLDDAHQVSDWPKHPVLDALMTGLDARAHLLVLSRTDIDDHYVREVINRRIQRVGPALFQWQTPQLKAWAKQRWGLLDIDDSAADAILKLSRGRAAILALLDIQTLVQDSSARRKKAAKQLELSELMESSLLARLRPEERASLFWLACLDSFPRRWLHTLGFPAAVQACVDLWQQNSSVVHTLERDRGELRFHPLFAEILRGTTNADRSDPTGLCERIIDACIKQERHFDAISLCRHTESWHKYWELLQRVGLNWIAQGQIGSLAQALSDLPERVLQQLAGPSLSLFLAAVNLGYQPRLAYSQALDALEASHGIPELRALWAYALAFTANAVIASGYHMGYIQPVIDALDGAIEAPWFSELPAQLRLVALMAGVIASMAGQERPPMQTLYRETERAMLECPDIELQAAIVAALARVVFLHGLPEYAEAVEQHILRIEGHDHSLAAELSLLHAKTTYHLTNGNYLAGLNAARTLWTKSSNDQPAIWYIEILASGAFCAANVHDLESTKALLKPMLAQRRLGKDANILANMHGPVYLGCIAGHEGRWTDAYTEYSKAKQSADEYRYSLMQVGTRCCLAMVCLELGKEQEANMLLKELDLQGIATTHPLNRRLKAFLQAFLSLRSGPLDKARSQVKHLLEDMARSNSYVQVTSMLPHYAEFLSFALHHNIKPKLVHEIIRRGPIYPKKRPHPAWPSYIEVEVLGRFRIHINGQDARRKLVSSGRRFELLTALLWWGGQGLSYDQCIQWIWHYIPDRARAIRSIKTALRRLNDDLGRDDAVLDEQGKISINPELWTYQAMKLHEALLTQGPRPELLNQLNRGFIGPTPIPPGMRKVVPSKGAIDFGPKPLLNFLGLDGPLEHG